MSIPIWETLGEKLIQLLRQVTHGSIMPRPVPKVTSANPIGSLTHPIGACSI